MNSVAVLSDIHGNRWALEAVLEDVAKQQVDAVVNLGDSLWGVLAPAETADLLMARRIVSIRGNEDREILEHAGGEVSVSLRHTMAAMDSRRTSWLASQPATYAIGEILLCHGTPASDTCYLLEAVTERGVVRRDAGEVRAALRAIDHAVVLCGHSHLPGSLQVPDGPLVVNPGSVGLQAFTDDSPIPHRIESGTPHARYAIIRRRAAGWDLEHRALRYDWEAASECARRNGRADWAHQLLTGLAAAP